MKYRNTHRISALRRKNRQASPSPVCVYSSCMTGKPVKYTGNRSAATDSVMDLTARTTGRFCFSV